MQHPAPGICGCEDMPAGGAFGHFTRAVLDQGCFLFYFS
jgi:hypothetical protein